MYIRPFIRHKIGSASQSWLNPYALYIGWLLSSLLYHLPTLEHMGINVKADVSLSILMYLAAFLVRKGGARKGAEVGACSRRISKVLRV